LQNACPAAAIKWAGDVASSFGGGSGTEADPYLISTPSQLAYLAKSTNDKTDYTGVYFKQTADFDLDSKPWTPIGTGKDKDDVFKGVYDGAGHKIVGLNCDTTKTDSTYAGLFGYVVGAVIKNVHVEGPYVSGTKYAGPIAARGSNLVHIINCSTKVDAVDGESAGGIVGRTDFASFSSDKSNTIVYCTSNSNIITANNVESIGSSRNFIYAGGIVGATGSTIISYCTNNGKIEIVPLAKGERLCFGGIVGIQGASNFSTSVFFCVNTGDVISYAKYKSTSSSIPKYLGGVVGHFTNVDGCVLAGSLNIGTVAVYASETSKVVEQEGGGVIGRVTRICAALYNYSTSKIGIADNTTSFLTDKAAITLTLDKMKGQAALTNMQLGTTIKDVLSIMVEIGLKNSFYLESELKEIEDSLKDKTLSEYLNARVAEAFGKNVSLTDALWKANDNNIPGFTEFEKASSAANVIENVKAWIDNELDVLYDAAKNPGSDTTANDTTADTTNAGTKPSEETKNDAQTTKTDTTKDGDKGNATNSSTGIIIAVVIIVVVAGGVVAYLILRSKKRNIDGGKS